MRFNWFGSLVMKIIKIGCLRGPDTEGGMLFLTLSLNHCLFSKKPYFCLFFTIMVRNVLNENPKGLWLLGDNTMVRKCIILGSLHIPFYFVREYCLTIMLLHRGTKWYGNNFVVRFKFGRYIRILVP